jgi:thiosulfate/3-mercaptopyruvate sulfurtransferase
MNSGDNSVSLGILLSTALIAFAAAAAALVLHGAPQQMTAPPNQEIPASETIQPDELAKELTSKDKPIVVCVAPRFLYDGAHIPGALFHGPGSTTDGLKDLRHWAQGTAHDLAVVLYCGCCPLSRCPNVRPALAELREMGFTRLRVLWLPKDFHTDWIEKGYPVEKGP